MPFASRLLAALDAVGETHRAIAVIAGQSKADRAKQLVEERRRLAERIGALAEAAADYWRERADAEAEHRFRQLLSAMRSAAALHQATWPAVKLLEGGEGYEASARRVREAHATFDNWLRPRLNAERTATR
jgi:vacuolar-type H+-ATPase subunit E/Vma4